MWERRDHGTLLPGWFGSECNVWHLTCLSDLQSSHSSLLGVLRTTYGEPLNHSYEAFLAVLRHIKPCVETCCCSCWKNTFRGSLKKRQTSMTLRVTLDLSFTGALRMVIEFSAVMPQDSLSKSDVWSYLTTLILCCLWAATVPSHHFHLYPTALVF